MYKQINSGSFKNIINKLFFYESNIFTIYMNKQDLALNNKQGVHMP